MTGRPNDGSRSRRAALWAQRFGGVAALLVVCVFGTIRYPAFATTENLFNVARQNSMLGLVALGMTLVIASGGIDLSVGSLVAIGGIAAATLTRAGTAVALLGASALTAVLGLGNGLVITKARIQPFITTLAMGIAAHGLALGITHEVAIRADHGAVAFAWLGRGLIGPVPVPVLLLIAFYGGGTLLLKQTKLGRHIYAVGDSEEAARLMGLNVDRVKIAVYTCSGALSGLAGALLASRLGTGQPTAGTGWELDAIAAVVIGGTLLTGGRGGASATLIGVMLMGILLNLFNLQGTVSSWWQLVLRGGFLLIVILAQRRLSQASERDGPVAS